MPEAAAAITTPKLLTTHQNLAAPVMITMGVIATIILGIIPIFVAGMVTELSLGDSEVGILASADMCGSTIAALIGLYLQPRLRWQKILYAAILIAISGNLISIMQDSFWPLVACRVLAGFGNGFIIALVFIGLCHSKNPDRGFGFYTLGQIGTQTVLLASLPYLINVTGMNGVYLLLAVASLLSASLIRFFPVALAQNEPSDRNDGVMASARITRWAILALIALTCYFIAIAAIWGYLEPIGGGFSLSLIQVGHALGTASFIAIAGPLAVIILATRFGRIPSLVFAVGLHLISALILIYGSGYFQFFVAAGLFAFALNYSFPYQMGILSTFDKDGSVAIIALILQLASFTFGPILASLLLFGGYDLILWACQLLIVLGLIAYWISVKKS